MLLDVSVFTLILGMWGISESSESYTHVQSSCLLSAFLICREGPQSCCLIKLYTDFFSIHGHRFLNLHLLRKPLSNLSARFMLSLVNFFMFTQNSVLWCKRYFASECENHFAPGVKKSFRKEAFDEWLNSFHVKFPMIKPQISPTNLKQPFLKTPQRGGLTRKMLRCWLIAGWQRRVLLTRVQSDPTESGTEPQQVRIHMLMQDPITIFEELPFDTDFREPRRRVHFVKRTQ